MTKPWRWIASRKKLIVILLVIGAFGYYLATRNTDEDTETATVEFGDIQEVLVLTGTLRAKEHAAMRFPTSGKLSWLGVVEGQEVAKGTTLAKLDTTTLFADLEQAESTLRDSEAGLAVVYDEVKDHDADESLAQKELRTTAEVAKDIAYRNVVKARYNLANATLVAPFSGFVTRLVSTFTGVNVLGTETVVELLNPDTLYFDVAADQTEVTEIFEGQKVEVVLDSFDDKVLKGTVGRVALTPVPGEIGSIYQVEVVFDNQSIDIAQVKVGMTGEAQFVLSRKTNVLKVPSGFVNTDTSGKYINLGRPDNKVYVEVGIEGEDDIEITGDVAEGETVFD